MNNKGKVAKYFWKKLSKIRTIEHRDGISYVKIFYKNYTIIVYEYESIFLPKYDMSVVKWGDDFTSGNSITLIEFFQEISLDDLILVIDEQIEKEKEIEQKKKEINIFVNKYLSRIWKEIKRRK